MTQAKKKEKTNSAPAKKLPAPDDRELSAIVDAAKRQIKRKPRIKVKADMKGGTLAYGPPHNDNDGLVVRLVEAFGTTSLAFAERGVFRVSNIIRDRAGDADQNALNAALAFIDGLEPRNEVEAALAIQMYAAHDLALSLASKAKHSEYVNQANVFGNLSIKLMRTYAAQVEALAKLRRGGEQTVRVEHVHVHSGGQAIVGTVNRPGGGEYAKSEEQGHEQAAIAHAAEPPVWSPDPQGEPLPVACDEEREM